MAEVAEGLGAMRAVTTFSAQGYEVYGRTMIESFLEHWPEEVELWAFYERNKPRDASDRVIWKSLQDDKEWQKFAREHHHKDDPSRLQIPPGSLLPQGVLVYERSERLLCDLDGRRHRDHAEGHARNA
jgi:hypothetical protein